jgi:hypothetical protein
VLEALPDEDVLDVHVGLGQQRIVGYCSNSSSSTNFLYLNGSTAL